MQDACFFVDKCQSKAVQIGYEEDLEIMLDGRYLLDALKAIKEDKVVLSFHRTIRPVLVHPFGNEIHQHLISPVRS